MILLHRKASDCSCLIFEQGNGDARLKILQLITINFRELLINTESRMCFFIFRTFTKKMRIILNKMSKRKVSPPVLDTVRGCLCGPVLCTGTLLRRRRDSRQWYNSVDTGTVQSLVFLTEKSDQEKS